MMSKICQQVRFLVTEPIVPVGNCQECYEMVKYRNKVCSGGGARDAKVMFLGQAPAKGLPNEPSGWCGANHTGVPFTNLPSGARLRWWIFKAVGAKIAEEKFYLTNTVKCFPGKQKTNSNDRAPSKEEVKKCWEKFLSKELVLIKPKLLVCVGSIALNNLLDNLGQPRRKFIDLHLEVLHTDLFDILAIPHPARFGPTLKKWKMSEDTLIERLRNILGNYRLIS